MSSSSRIVQLSGIIADNTAKVDNYLRSQNLPQPSFEVNGPTEIIPGAAPEIEAARNNAVEASIELQELLQGPSVLPFPHASANGAPLLAIYRFQIAEKIPVNGEISFGELADLCGLYEHDLRRIVRYAISHHRIFCEPRKGVVVHSAASRHIAENSQIRDLMGLSWDECYPAHARVVDALSRFNKSQEPNASGYALANNTSEPLYTFLSQHPARAKRFAGAMSTTSVAGLEFLSSVYPWTNVRDRGIIVDLGGSQGHVSVFLAEKFPSLQFIVQDLPGVISDERSTYQIPESVAGRVKLMAHDFFTEQPVKDVDVFLIRYTFHNWSDAYCIRILQNLIPAMKPGTMVVINDHLMPEPNTLPLLKERYIRAMDMIMLAIQNAREREKDDWAGLFQQADKRFKFVSINAMENSASAVIVAIWEGR